MKTVLRLFMLASFALITKANAQQQVTFSVQAHEDDWQLFWVQSMMNDLNAGNKVVFITVTSGDAGNGTGRYCSPIPFFVGRERSSTYSAKHAIDLNGGVATERPDSVRTTVNGKSMMKYTYKNSVNYFLRLPDGNVPGEGFPITGNQSLKKFKRGLIPTMTTIDGLATYNNWQDLVTTIGTIIDTERGTDNQAVLHTASLDTAGANSNDHSDHIHVSLAAQQAVAAMPWIGINEYIDYNSPSFPANLTLEQHAAAVAIYAVNCWGLLESKYAAPFDAGHKSWLPVDVLIVKRAPSGNAPGTVAPPSGGFAAQTTPAAAGVAATGVITLEEYKKIK
jgi:LmbE family N-acetylglucosaminyl deacetylase